MSERGGRASLDIERIAAGGAGVGRLPDGRVVFVHRTAPGDRATIELTLVKKSWARGRLLQLVEAGPDRRPAPCPHYARCGGCTLEHLSYTAQLRAKAGLVVDALERIGGRKALPDPEVHPSPREFRYRNRVSFTLRRLSNQRVVAGFHQLEKPNRILDLDGRCLLPEEPIARAWDTLRAAWGPEARRLPEGPELRLTLRTVNTGSDTVDEEAPGEEGTPAAGAARAQGGDSVLLLVEGGTARADSAREAEELLGQVPGLQAVWHRPEGEREAALLAGERALEEVWHGERYTVKPGAFFQVNRAAARMLHDFVLRELGAPRERRVVDAYCGVGVYGRRMARHGAEAVGIEADPAAVRMARERPVDRFAVLEGKVEERIGEALPADLVVLNPPRTGVAEGVMETLASAGGPSRIVYVSCNPATLARDMGRLGEGYRIARIQVFDLFPQTAHVETVLTLDPVRTKGE